MKNPLCDQERLEAETSMRMTPRQHLDWLAIARDFVQMIERSRPTQMRKSSNGG